MNYDEKEVGVGDFVLLPQINMESFLENLKIRHSAGNIYTYIGKYTLYQDEFITNVIFKYKSLYGQDTQ